MNRYPSRHTHRDVLEAGSVYPGPLTLAVVIATRGSSYRKAGALALLCDDGLVAGCISGGCLEQDLIAKAHDARRLGLPCVHRFDTRSDEDRWFGSQTGCRGEIDILLVPADADGTHSLLAALQAADAAQQTLWLDAATPVAVRWSLQMQAGALALRPSPRLLLLGGGPEAPPLLTLARTLGWYTTVVEHRERYLAGGRLGAADLIIAERPSAALRRGFDTRFDAVLCMTHLYEEDRQCLNLLALAPPVFVGVVGPAQRRDELLAELGADAAAALAHLKGPVGLMLGAHGPEAMALAIMAQLTGG